MADGAEVGAQPRFEVLDGLRGTAALVVLVFHLLEVLWWDPAKNPLHHAYLAVDFFFMLSGFVIGHAYDARWPRMTVRQFFVRRLMRLHPLAMLAAILGFACYLADPFAQGRQQAPPAQLLAALVLALLVLPSPSLPNRFTETHSLNGPSWTLLQEYLANIAYALVLRRLGVGALALATAAAGAALILAASQLPNLGAGWSWETIWFAPIRTAFPFLAGLLLQRTGARLRLPGGWALLSVVLLAVFAAPTLATEGIVKANGLFDALLIVAVFPLVIAAGAAAQARGVLGRLCRFCGDVSYPLYITHYILIYVFTHWVWVSKAPRGEVLVVGGLTAASCILFAWVALKLFDEPLRAWLTRRRIARTAVAPAVVP